MSRRRAIITQADVARTIRAAQQTGAAGVKIQPDGTILILLSTENPQNSGVNEAPIAPEDEVVL